MCVHNDAETLHLGSSNIMTQSQTNYEQIDKLRPIHYIMADVPNETVVNLAWTPKYSADPASVRNVYAQTTNSCVKPGSVVMRLELFFVGGPAFRATIESPRAPA